MIKLLKNNIGYKFVALGFLLVGCFYSGISESATVDNEIVKNVQIILNSTDSFVGDFRQTSSNGDAQKGKIYLQKPGNMRIEYSKTGMLVLTDSKNLVYYDPKIDQKTLIDLDSTPAGILVKKDIKLGGDAVKILSTREDSSNYYIAMALKKDAGLGKMEFVISKSTKLVVGWTVRDSQGVSTVFAISNMKKNVAIDKSKFRFTKKKNYGVNGSENGNDYY